MKTPWLGFFVVATMCSMSASVPTSSPTSPPTPLLVPNGTPVAGFVLQTYFGEPSCSDSTAVYSQQVDQYFAGGSNNQCSAQWTTQELVQLNGSLSALYSVNTYTYQNDLCSIGKTLYSSSIFAPSGQCFEDSSTFSAYSMSYSTNLPPFTLLGLVETNYASQGGCKAGTQADMLFSFVNALGTCTYENSAEWIQYFCTPTSSTWTLAEYQQDTCPTTFVNYYNNDFGNCALSSSGSEYYVQSCTGNDPNPFVPPPAPPGPPPVAFKSFQPPQSNTMALALGLGLGLGIPIGCPLLVMLFTFCVAFWKMCCRCSTRNGEGGGGGDGGVDAAELRRQATQDLEFAQERTREAERQQEREQQQQQRFELADRRSSTSNPIFATAVYASSSSSSSSTGENSTTPTAAVATAIAIDVIPMPSTNPSAPPAK